MDPGTVGLPFDRHGLLRRALPFAGIALLAELSLVFPPGEQSAPDVAWSLGLLACVVLAFLLPWQRMPGWATVLVPLVYAGSVLALSLAAGPNSGVGIVILIPLVWVTLFHRPWESAYVIAAIVAVEVTVSVEQAAPAGVTVRRLVLWALLGSVVAVATHGLRDQLRRAHAESMALQEQVHALAVTRDRDRIAATLQDLVVRRLFAAGLRLQGAASMTTDGELQQRIRQSVDDLDDSVRMLRESVFGQPGTEGDSAGLRRRLLELYDDADPKPELHFTGPVDQALPAEAASQLIDLLRQAGVLLAPSGNPARVDVEAGEALVVALAWPAAALAVPELDADLLAELELSAGRAGARVQADAVPGGTRLAWHLTGHPARTGGN